MKNSAYRISGMVLVFLIQLAVPAKMIFDQEGILKEGKEYKFKTAPIDPNDPFRGKYLNLAYEANEWPITNPDNWSNNMKIFVLLTTDPLGFAKVRGVSQTQPPETESDYVQAKVNYVANGNEKKLVIEYPFSRYYVEESIARSAEDTYREAAESEKKTGYAVVCVKNGKSALKELMVNDKPLIDWVKEYRQKK